MVTIDNIYVGCVIVDGDIDRMKVIRIDKINRALWYVTKISRSNWATDDYCHRLAAGPNGKFLNSWTVKKELIPIRIKLGDLV